MPYAQAVQADRQVPAAVNLLATIAGPTANAAADLRRLARDLNPNAPVSEAAALEEMVTRSTADFQSTMWLFLSFAGVSVLLAAVGIYGLVSNSVAQRTHEIGLRVAIGATRPEILKLMLGQSLRLALAGIAVGVIESIILTRFLASMLYGVAATDPATFACVCGLMLAIAGTRQLFPCVARRQSRSHQVPTRRINWWAPFLLQEKCAIFFLQDHSPINAPSH